MTTYAEELNNLNFELFLPNKELLESIPVVGVPSDLNDYFVAGDKTFKQAEFDPTISEIDKWDYIVSIGSAVLASVLDILWIKDLSLEDAQKWGKTEADEFVKKIAKKKGYKGDSVDGAIRKLEELFKIPADELADKFGGGKQHHLSDFSHHASPLGLCFSIITQFTGHVFGTDINGKFVWHEVPTDEHIGKSFEEKIFNGIVIWSFHMISDFDGSSGSNGWGTGVPGPILSFFKELSALPIINEIKVKYKGQETKLPVIISKLFNGAFFPHDTKEEIIRFDLRTEMGIFHQMSKQSIPVIANECIVRAFYTFRRLFLQIKENNVQTLKDLRKINPKTYLPFNNRTIIRMITVSSGAFMLIVTSEAAIKAVSKNGDFDSETVVDFLLGINYPGVVRFVLACKADAKYLSEDMKKACKDFAKKHKWQNQSTINSIPGLEYLALTETQLRILASLERQKILYDIDKTKSQTQIKKKHSWLSAWESVVENADSGEDYFIREETAIYQSISDELAEKNDGTWIYLIALELGLFEPYYPLGSHDDKQYKSIKLMAKYELDKFCLLQEKVSPKLFMSLINTYHKDIDNLNNKSGKLIAGAAITVGATALTGGLAWFFAPEIAVLIAGESVLGLYGAALTSASLAFVGGGALAVGGLGMAGGTAIIVGGGALLGIVGSGVANMPSIMALSTKGEILQNCAKLMAFCKCILIDELQKFDTVGKDQRQHY